MIRIREGYSLRNVLDVYVVMNANRETYEPNRIMSLNGSGAYLWELLENGADAETLCVKLTEEYDVDTETAAADVQRFLGLLAAKGLTEEC